MGIDLACGFIAIASLSTAAYLLGSRISAEASLRNTVLFLGTLGLALLFAWCSSGKLHLASIISGSAALYWSNAMPILLGFSAGLATNSPGLVRWHRPVTVCVLGLLGLGYILTPIARPILNPIDINESSKWSDDVCLQSHSASCAPAAGATLLRLEGVKTSERLMAEACLTSAHGTMPLGLYRGVFLVASRHNRSAKVASSDPSQWISLGQLPNVAIVQFTDESDAGRYTQLLGSRGEGHVVVVRGKTDAGRWIIGDPAIGSIVWTDEELKSRFTGEAIFISQGARRNAASAR
jgi:predicted double-glycine peptidase